MPLPRASTTRGHCGSVGIASLAFTRLARTIGPIPGHFFSHCW